MTAKFSIPRRACSYGPAALAETVAIPIPFCGFFTRVLYLVLSTMKSTQLSSMKIPKRALILDSDDFNLRPSIRINLANKYAGFYLIG